MICKTPECGKEITSNLTGDLCTGCYFKAKKANGPQPNQAPNKAWIKPTVTDITNTKPTEQKIEQEDKPILLGKVKSAEDAENPTHAPSKLKVTEAPKDGKRYCQWCIERYGSLVLASREWTPGYFICDDCMRALLESQVDYDSGRVETAISTIKSAPTNPGPILTQFYDLLNIPEHLRYNLGEQVLHNRNEIFNYHAPALVNRSFDEVQSQIEMLSVLLFHIKIAIEPRQAYIDRIKYEERAKANLSGLDKSEKEFSKQGRSKTKMSQDEKMARQLGMTVEKYREMAQNARKTEFKKITGT